MNFNELIAAVYVETNRPDMVEDTKQKVFSSTLKMHCLDYFYKDILEAQIVFAASSYIQQLDTSAMLRFRNISALRRYDPSLQASQLDPTVMPPITWVNGIPTSNMPFYEIITPDCVLDEFGYERLNVMYQAGTSINIKSAVPLQYALAAWYAYPSLDISGGGAQYSSWIATEFPYAIIYDAASALLTMIGQQEASRKYDDPKVGLATVARDQLHFANITAKGR